MTTQDRYHHLDAVRAGALLAGILLHALMSYLPGFREVNYPLADASTNTGLGVAFFVIHMFRMSLFFLIAGFFARLLHQRLGTKGLIKNRARRIGLPLLAFYFLVMPAIIAAFIWGARQMGIKAQDAAPPPMPIVGPPIPWGHLWFLYLLLILIVLTMALRSIVVRLDAAGGLRASIQRLFARAMALRVGALALTIPVGLSLYLSPWWVQWQGIPSPLAGLVPNFPGLLAYGLAFLAGWFIHRQQDILDLLSAQWLPYLAVALACTVVALTVGGVTPRFKVAEMDGGARALYTLAYVLGQWCWIFAILGFATRYLQAPSARWRYLADASYWMYLIHLPVVMLLQAWMLSWSVHWSIKLSLVLTITGVVLLASYHVAVRPTFMGVFLNGRKYPRLKGAPVPG
jgi:hypothetical protein